jgi:cytochrome c
MRVFQIFGPTAALIAGLALSACATREPGAAPLRPDSFAIARGREIAEFHCASCHQIGPNGASPSMMAAPFHSLYISYSHLAFRKAVESSRDEPAHTMPGYDLNRDQVDDLVAYLESNRPADGAK